MGLQDRDVTIAQLLKDKGYATGQFGKNHLGDKDEYLPPTMALMNFSAIFITSTRKKNRKIRTTPKRRAFARISGHAGLSTLMLTEESRIRVR